MNKAIFFDRDGCLIVDKNYLCDPQQVEFFADTFSALSSMASRFKLFMVTNQSGIGRGMFSEEQMHQVHQKMEQVLRKNGIQLEEIAFCPHTPEENCDCRKPQPKLVNALCQKHHIDKNGSYFIGDKISDAQCGDNAGITGCLIHNENEKYPSFRNLTEFANFVLK